MNKLVKAAALGACRTTFPLTEKLFEIVLGSHAAEVPLHKPVIVIGPERSGTTLIYALLANHPDMFALFNSANVFPDHPFSSTLALRLFSRSAPIYVAVPDTVGQVKGDRFTPCEGVRYWMRHLGSKSGGWANAPDDYFSDEDLDAVTRETLPLDLRRRIYSMGKKRLLLKQPGFSLKVKYLDALFPDAIFVHCIRNPVDNFASLMAQKAALQNPDWGVRVPDWEKWRDLPIEVRAARQLAVTHRMIQESIGQIKNSEHRYVPVRYEDLHGSFATEVQRLFGRCELEAPSTVLDNSGLFVLSSGRRNAGMDIVQNRQARETLEELCCRLGYDSSVQACSPVANVQSRPVQQPEPLGERLYQGIFGIVSNAAQMAVRASAAILPRSWLSNYRATAKWFFARNRKSSFHRPSLRKQWAENWITILASWALLAGVTTLHYFSNPHMIFTPFYVIPCGMLALTLNSRWGVVIAGAAAIAGPVVQSMVSEDYGVFSVILWNSMMRFIMYVTFVFLLDRVRVEAVSTQAGKTSNA